MENNNRYGKKNDWGPVTVSPGFRICVPLYWEPAFARGIPTEESEELICGSAAELSDIPEVSQVSRSLSIMYRSPSYYSAIASI